MKRAHPSPDTIFNQRQAWDAEYEAKGPLWGNIPLEPTTPNKQGLFVDLGCGNGKNLLKYHHDATKIGLDFSMQALYLCRKRNELSDVTLICADVKSLPFQDSCIHHIDAHHLLGHLLLQERMHAAQEISRVLIPGGDLVVTVFATKDFRYRCGREVEDRTFMRGNGIITHYFSENEIISLFPDLTLQTIKESSWIMRVRERKFQRCVWVIQFTKRELKA